MQLVFLWKLGNGLERTKKDWGETRIHQPFLFHTVSPVGTYAVRKRLLVPRGKRYPINVQHLHFIS